MTAPVIYPAFEFEFDDVDIEYDIDDATEL